MGALGRRTLLLVAAAVILACGPQRAHGITTTGPSCKVAPPPGLLALPRCPPTTKTLADAKAGEPFWGRLQSGGDPLGRRRRGAAAAAACSGGQKLDCSLLVVVPVAQRAG